MNTGGYQILDFGGKAFTAGTAKIVKNAYNKVSTENVVLISGLKIGVVTYKDVYVAFQKVSDTYVCSIYGYTITITNEDSVTVTANVIPVDLTQYFSVLDLSGKTFVEGEGQIIDNSYVTVAPPKMVIIHGLKVGTTTYNDFIASFTQETGKRTATANGFDIQVGAVGGFVTFTTHVDG